jgi:hypothetical protein
MAGNERTLDEHYRDDPERADATVSAARPASTSLASTGVDSWAAADWPR